MYKLSFKRWGHGSNQVAETIDSLEQVFIGCGGKWQTWLTQYNMCALQALRCKNVKSDKSKRNYDKMIFTNNVDCILMKPLTMV